MVKYKEMCKKCRKNYIIVNRRERYPLCYDCQKPMMQGEIKSKKLKELFDIPEEFYRESLFLRNIKIYYIKFGSLSAKQVSAFKKVVKDMKNPKPKEKVI